MVSVNPPGYVCAGTTKWKSVGSVDSFTSGQSSITEEAASAAISSFVEHTLTVAFPDAFTLELLGVNVMDFTVTSPNRGIFNTEQRFLKENVPLL